MRLRDFEKKDPLRGEVTPSNVVIEDIVSAFGAMHDDLRRFTTTAEPRFGTLTARSASKMKDTIDLFIRGVRDEQRRLNQEWEAGKEERREDRERAKVEAVAERKAAKEERRAENRRKWGYRR